MLLMCESSKQERRLECHHHRQVSVSISRRYSKTKPLKSQQMYNLTLLPQTGGPCEWSGADSAALLHGERAGRHWCATVGHDATTDLPRREAARGRRPLFLLWRAPLLPYCSVLHHVPPDAAAARIAVHHSFPS